MLENKQTQEGRKLKSATRVVPSAQNTTLEPPIFSETSQSLYITTHAVQAYVAYLSKNVITRNSVQDSCSGRF